MELVKVENGSIVLSEVVEEKLRAFQVEKLRMEMLEKQIKEAMLNAMKENGVKSYESDNVKITYKDAYIRKSVDTQALKDEGLFDLYSKETLVKESVQITWRD